MGIRKINISGQERKDRWLERFARQYGILPPDRRKRTDLKSVTNVDDNGKVPDGF